jgi:hypothetical protein
MPSLLFVNHKSNVQYVHMSIFTTTTTTMLHMFPSKTLCTPWWNWRDYNPVLLFIRQMRCRQRNATSALYSFIYVECNYWIFGAMKAYNFSGPNTKLTMIQDLYFCTCALQVLEKCIWSRLPPTYIFGCAWKTTAWSMSVEHSQKFKSIW